MSSTVVPSTQVPPQDTEHLRFKKLSTLVQGQVGIFEDLLGKLVVGRSHHTSHERELRTQCSTKFINIFCYCCLPNLDLSSQSVSLLLKEKYRWIYQLKIQVKKTPSPPSVRLVAGILRHDPLALLLKPIFRQAEVQSSGYPRTPKRWGGDLVHICDFPVFPSGWCSGSKC